MVILGEDLDRWISAKRDEGRSWRLVARDLFEATDGEIDVTYETLRAWYASTDSTEEVAK